MQMSPEAFQDAPSSFLSSAPFPNAAMQSTLLPVRSGGLLPEIRLTTRLLLHALLNPLLSSLAAYKLSSSAHVDVHTSPLLERSGTRSPRLAFRIFAGRA